MAGRSTGWLDSGFQAKFRELMLHVAVREHLFCPIYTLMPDHLHLIWMGMATASDQRFATRFLRRYLAPRLEPHRWQHQPYDHVLREEERKERAFETMVQYVAENAMRAGLCDEAGMWPYTGCVVPGYPDLHPLSKGFWERFWRLFNAAVETGGVGKLPVQGE